MKFECDNASTVYWDCDNDGGTYTGSAAEDLETVAGSGATSASSAQPSTTSSGLSAGSLAGSVVGATLGAIALVIVPLFGYKALKRRQPHRQSQSQTQLEGLLAPVELHTVANTEVRELGAGRPLSELPAENRHEMSSDLHGSRAESS